MARRDEIDRAFKIGEISDEAIIYQLEKVDSGGAIAEVFEDRMGFLSEEWGFSIEDSEENPHYGDLKLPDGRYAGLMFKAYIIDPNAKP